MVRVTITKAAITRAVKAVQAAGLAVVRVEVAPDGTVAAYCGVADVTESSRNSVDEALDEALNQ